MLKIDREGEEFVFSNDWDILIPVEIVNVPETGLTLSVIPRLRAVGKRFLKLFSDRPFSDGAIAWLWNEIAPEGEAWGYLRTRYATRRCRIFRFPADAAPGAPLPGGRLLTAEDEKNNRTTFDLAETVADGRLCFGQIEGGRVVSVAVTHASPDEREPGGTLEIGVETIPEARRRGYAASSLAGLTGAILSAGLIPEYRCTCSNVASAKVARVAGYRQIGEACSFVMRKKGR
ncbi:MAG: GNAT family N-acetyltransferase [Clostridia bacterium]|nr:GNAT family N-acetyltransferase [Clostridia bacterium]